jgi:heme-degrading monooxygenase HmoA
MFARVTWSKLGGQEGQFEAGKKRFQERVLPSLQAQSGFLGAALLLDAEAGEGASVTYWQTAESMAASEPVATAARTEIQQASGNQVQDIDRFEVVLQDRAAPVQVGTFVRTNDVTAAKAQVDATLAFMRDSALPAIKQLNGYRALLIFVNRESGRMLVSSVWNTAADREASESVVSGLRRQAIDQAQAQAPRITRYETILAEVSPAAQQAASVATTA